MKHLESTSRVLRLGEREKKQPNQKIKQHLFYVDLFARPASLEMIHLQVKGGAKHNKRKQTCNFTFKPIDIYVVPKTSFGFFPTVLKCVFILFISLAWLDPRFPEGLHRAWRWYECSAPTTPRTCKCDRNCARKTFNSSLAVSLR